MGVHSNIEFRIRFTSLVLLTTIRTYVPTSVGIQTASNGPSSMIFRRATSADSTVGLHIRWFTIPWVILEVGVDISDYTIVLLHTAVAASHFRNSHKEWDEHRSNIVKAKIITSEMQELRKTLKAVRVSLGFSRYWTPFKLYNAIIRRLQEI